jgi:hypothetical protein
VEGGRNHIYGWRADGWEDGIDDMAWHSAAFGRIIIRTMPGGEKAARSVMGTHLKNPILLPCLEWCLHSLRRGVYIYLRGCEVITALIENAWSLIGDHITESLSYRTARLCLSLVARP